MVQVVLIPKGVIDREIVRYRCISMISVLGKLLELLIRKRLEE